LEQVSTSDRRRACASLGNDRCLEIARTSFLRRSQFSSEIVALHRAGMKFVALSWCKAPPFLAERQSYWAQRWIKRRSVGASVVMLALLALCGCSEVGAPSFDLFGAFFPAWLLCGVFGIFVALSARIFFATRNLTDVLPFQLSLCTSLGAISALLLWLVCFGR
jgi:hypothetical protein